ncbi:MAG: hypothetical protein NVS1B11_31690 [Terriglobales bacterium]
MDERRVMTLREVARYLSVHPNTVYRLAKQGKIPAFKVGSYWRFNRASIELWCIEQEQARVQSRPFSLGPASESLGKELIDITCWMQSEAGQDTVSAADLRVFTDAGTETLQAEVARLLKDGLFQGVKLGNQVRYRLTLAGRERARALSAGRQDVPGHASVLQLDAGPHVNRSAKNSGGNSWTP